MIQVLHALKGQGLSSKKAREEVDSSRIMASSHLVQEKKILP